MIYQIERKSYIVRTILASFFIFAFLTLCVEPIRLYFRSHDLVIARSEIEEFVLYTGIFIVTISLFLIVGCLYFINETFHSAWKAQIEEDEIILDTITRKHKVKWSDIRTIEKAIGGYKLVLGNGKRLRIASRLDQDGTLLKEIKSHMSVPSEGQEFSGA